MRAILFSLLFLGTHWLMAQTPVPAPPQRGSILILGAVAHLGNGSLIANSAVAFENGRLTLVADATTIRLDRSKYSAIYEASGKHIYPGFIAPNSQLGLIEVNAVRSTNDAGETGGFNPNTRTIIAYNTDSEVTPTVRSNGVLLSQPTPTGGLISGSSSVVQHDAWNWEDAAVRTDDGIHLNWPTPRIPAPEAGPGERERPVDRYVQDVQALQQFFSEAQAYARQPKPAVVNQRFEALRGLFAQTKRLYIHTNAAKQIEESVLFAEQFGMSPVVVGGNDCWQVVAFLKAHQVPVILSRTQRLPERDDEDVDQPYKTAVALQQAGVVFAFSNIVSWQQRNLAFQAGQAVGQGLPYEAAVQALTGNTAKILGIDKDYGTLEVGKSATLFISDGDALDMRTCQVTAAFIQGRAIDLNNKQKELNRKFEEKYRAQKAKGN